MIYARIIDSRAVDVTDNPTGLYHPTIAAEFVEVPAEVKRGWIYDTDADQWNAPPEPDADPVDSPVRYPVISPLDFTMCLTVAERLAAAEIAKTDPVLNDFWVIIKDPRLTEVDLNLQSVRDAVVYLFEQLVGNETVSEADKETRVAQVLSGTRL